MASSGINYKLGRDTKKIDLAYICPFCKTDTSIF